LGVRGERPSPSPSPSPSTTFSEHRGGVCPFTRFRFRARFPSRPLSAIHHKVTKARRGPVYGARPSRVAVDSTELRCCVEDRPRSRPRESAAATSRRAGMTAPRLSVSTAAATRPHSVDLLCVFVPWWSCMCHARMYDGPGYSSSSRVAAPRIRSTLGSARSSRRRSNGIVSSTQTLAKRALMPASSTVAASSPDSPKSR